MALITYPLNNIEYSAEDAELFHVTRTSGVYAKNSFDYSVTGANNTIVINNGIGWIKNSEFSGKVIALKENISLDMGVSDSVYPRIDAIVIQFDSNKNETNIIAKQGTAASSPIAPSVIRTESVYELHLYHVRREAGSLYISPSNITDLRLNSSYCGLMADSVTNIDTTAIEKQVSDLIKSLQSEISNVKNGSAYLPRDGSTGMTGDLQMNGNKVTGLGAPEDDNDAVPKNYVDDGFAPAIESTDYPGCYYRTVNGATEWINPPMVPGVEYRTTKRYDSKVVYTQYLDMGALPNNSSKHVLLTNCAAADYPNFKSVRYEYSVKYSNYRSINPIRLTGSVSDGEIFWSVVNPSLQWTAYVRTNFDASGASATGQIWYTKD